MRKFFSGLLAAAISLTVFSCSNFAIPERAHVKTVINPNIPINSNKFNFSEMFQDQLSEVFVGAETQDQGQETIRIFDYTPPDAPDTQTFLFAFTMKEQSLDFADYFSETMLGEDSAFSAINHTFTLDPLSAENTAITIDMKDTITDILSDITFNDLTMPVGPGTLPLSIPLTASGFSNLSFYGGSLDITFTIPSGQNYSATLRNLKINNLTSSANPPEVILGSSQRSATARFPLMNQELTNSLSLSVSFSSQNAAPGASSLEVKIGFSNVTLKTAKGVSLGDNGSSSGDLGDGNPIKGFSVPDDFVQAEIAGGAINLVTSAIKGFDLDLSKMTIKQAEGNTDPYKQGLNCAGAVPTIPLVGQQLNRNPIITRGSYSLTAQNPTGAGTEITFNEQQELEIPITLKVESFEKVYVDGQKIIEDFNKDNGTYELDFEELSQTVSSIEVIEAGVELDFGENSQMTGLEVTIKSEDFHVNRSGVPAKGKEQFTNKTSTPPTGDFPYNVKDKPLVNFQITLSNGSNGSNILTLDDVVPGVPVTIIDCTPQVVFDWSKATIDPKASATDNDFTKGQFPQDDSEGFSLGDSEDLVDILKDFEFDKIEGYLFLSGPSSLDNGNITLDLKADTETLFPLPGKSNKIKIVSERLAMPEEEGEPFTENIQEKEPNLSSTGEIDFTDVFNDMLKPGGKLKIKYAMDFGDQGLVIINDPTAGPQVLKAELALIVPLKLVPAEGKDSAKIDVTKHLGEMAGKNLLDFTENMGDATQVSFTTLTLNIGLNGVIGGSLIIERNLAEDGVNQQIDPISLNDENIRIPLADYLGSSQKFTPEKIMLEIDKDGSLEIPRGLSLLSFSVNAGVDFTYDF
ncbi:MAG: hypothetical protein LBK63_01050 [Treponema sp.]|jgi:hypothetical protein|nr:hypothetical protein [Treponema sp.]